MDALLDSQFAGGKTTRPLHARLRLIFHDENDREEHFCVRALQLTNARAYQARLKAAMTQSGIDRALKFRHLTMLRSEGLPGGSVTQKLTQQFERAGGTFCKPTDDELRTLYGLHLLKQDGNPDFEKWLRDRQPVSKLSLIRTIVPSPFFGQEAGATTGLKAPNPRRHFQRWRCIFWSDVGWIYSR